MKDLHVMLGYGENLNTDITNTPFIGEVTEDRTEYIAVKDIFGDTLKLNDKNTSEMKKRLFEDLFDVMSSEIYTGAPRLLCLVSDKTNTTEIETELFNLVKTSTAFKPFREVLQVNNSKFELVPFVSADKVYTEIKILNTDTSKNLSESTEFLLTEFYKAIDIVIRRLWLLYNNMAIVARDLLKGTSEHFKDIIMVDMEIIESKCKLDLLREEVDALTILNKKFEFEDVDLRASSPSDVYSIKLSGASRQLSRYYILQIEDINSNPSLSSAVITLADNTVIDYVNSGNHNNGVVVNPEFLDTHASKVFLRGGRRYRVYRTADLVAPTTKSLKENPNVISSMKTSPTTHRLTGNLVLEKDHIYIRSGKHGIVELRITSK